MLVLICFEKIGYPAGIFLFLVRHETKKKNKLENLFKLGNNDARTIWGLHYQFWIYFIPSAGIFVDFEQVNTDWLRTASDTFSYYLIRLNLRNLAIPSKHLLVQVNSRITLVSLMLTLTSKCLVKTMWNLFKVNNKNTKRTAFWGLYC